jgi:hypothetical protein
MYTVEWYSGKDAHMPAYDFFSKTTRHNQTLILALFRILADHGKIYDHELFFPEQEGFYAFKIDPNHYLYCFFKSKKIIITNVFTKKILELPKEDKKQILDSLKDYKKRTVGGTYYSTKIKSTYEEFTQDPKRKAQVENQYRALLIAELILAAKNKDTKLVARIAKDVGLTPNISVELHDVSVDLHDHEKKSGRKRKKL